MSSTRIILVRHGETDASKERRFAGSTDVPLTDEGHAMAAALGARMTGVRIDVIHCSPLTRCRQTAAPVAAVAGREIEIDDAIRECSFGEWEDLALPAVVEGWPDHLQRWVGDETVAPPGGESWAEVRHRVVEWWDRTVQSHEGRTVCAVMHGGTIMSLARHLLHVSPETMSHMMVEPASVNMIQINAGRIRVRTWNDTTHYADPLEDERELPGRGPLTASTDDRVDET